MKDPDLDKFERDMNCNIESNEIFISDIIVEKTVKKHKIYDGKNIELQMLWESLKHFEVEDWEDDINWYKETPK